MGFFTFKLRPVSCSVTAAVVLASSPVGAATITYNLTNSDLGSREIQGSTETTSQVVADLSGSGAIPAVTLNVGDTINGTISFSTPVTVPGGNLGSNFVVALTNSTSIGSIGYTPNLQFFDNGVQVAAPASWQPLQDTTNFDFLEFGESSATATAAFTFNEIAFAGTITSMTSLSGGPVTSAAFNYNSDPTFQGNGIQASPVPLPAAAWLMVSGLGGLGVMARKRKAA